jgi:hypothetical protein
VKLVNSLANPLIYPLSVLVGGITLVVSVRLANLPSAIAVPMAIGVATVGAGMIKTFRPERLNLGNPDLERHLKAVIDSASALIGAASALSVEADKLLTESDQIELLAAVKYACDRTIALPDEIKLLAKRMSGANSLLMVNELKREINKVQNKLSASSGVERDELQKLKVSLENNLQLAQQGQDARKAQVINLDRLITAQAGILQQLQNKLRTSDLHNNSQVVELRSLSNDISDIYSNLNQLIAQ